MNDSQRRLYILFILLTLLGILWAKDVVSKVEAPPAKIPEVVATSTPARSLPKLSPEQEAWIDKLEYCESRNDPTAVNWIDLDGTPSYYSFQFKPDTFRFYGVLYKVLPVGLNGEDIMELIKDRNLQRTVVSFMVLDPGINWEQQFPGCVRKLGRPPKAS